MILDLGHFRFVNDKEQESSSNSNLVDDMEEDDGMANTHTLTKLCKVTARSTSFMVSKII